MTYRITADFRVDRDQGEWSNRRVYFTFWDGDDVVLTATSQELYKLAKDIENGNYEDVGEYVYVGTRHVFTSDDFTALKRILAGSTGGDE